MMRRFPARKMPTARVSGYHAPTTPRPPGSTIWGAEVCARNSRGKLFRVQATCCSHLRSCRGKHLCGA